jgi:hypothetical protein
MLGRSRRQSQTGTGAAEKSCQKVSLDIVVLGLQAGGQERCRRSSQNLILFNAEIRDFAGSPGIPSGQGDVS